MSNQINNNIIIVKKFFNRGKLNQYQSTIDCLHEAKKEFKEPAIKVFNQVIVWLISENEKPFSEQAPDAAYEAAQHKLNQAMRHSILRDQLSLFWLHIDSLKRLRRVIGWYSIIYTYGNESHKAKADLTVGRLADDFTNLVNATVAELSSIDKSVDKETQVIIKDFMQWFNENSRKPMPNLMKRRALIRWKRLLTYTISRNIPRNYFSFCDRMRFFLLNHWYDFKNNI